jgi:hypothetical protein
MAQTYSIDQIKEEMAVWDWDAIVNRVEEGSGVATVTMEQLRDASGYKKLGKFVCEEIHEKLTGMGLGTVPRQLPSRQYEPIRIYKRATPVGHLIELALNPGASNDGRLLRYRVKRDDRTRPPSLKVKPIKEG